MHFGADRGYIVIPNLKMDYGLYEADFVYINKNNYLTEVEIKISIADFKADFKKKHFLSCIHIRSLYYAMPFSMWKEHNEVINEMVKSVGAGLIVVGDVSPTVVIKAALRDVKPLTTQELINYMRIGCLKWCARAWYK
mgnify:CR=1 FL=1